MVVNMFASPAKAQKASYVHLGVPPATEEFVRVDAGQSEHQPDAGLPVTRWRLEIRGELNSAEPLAGASKDRTNERTDQWKGLR